MKKTTFTDTMVKKLKPVNMDYCRSEGNGFTVRVMPTGAKTWLYLYLFEGKRRKLNLGSYPDVTLEKARERFNSARKKVRNGIDPIAEKEQAQYTRMKEPDVNKLAREYMEKHAKKNKRESSWREDERLLEKNVLPTWGNRKAKDIKKRDVVLLLEFYSDRPALTHNIFKLVRRMFNFAVERDILEFTPCTGIKVDNIATITSRDRVLREAKANGGVDEILTLFTEIEKAAMSDQVKNIIKLILVTGQRPGEVAGIRENEITIEQHEENGRKWEETWWTIPVARRKVKEKSKNPPQPHRVYLSNLALKILGTQTVGGYYFPSPRIKYDKDNKPIYKHIDENAVAYAIRRNLKDYQPRRKIKGDEISMVKVKEERKMDIEHFTPHDLRRTCYTRMEGLGISLPIRAAVLGHVKTGMDMIYGRHQYDREKKIAMEAWERKLTAILTGGKDNVAIIGVKMAG